MSDLLRWYAPKSQDRPTLQSVSELFPATFRRLRRTPRYVVSIVSLLGLGLGANTAAFAFLNAVLLNRLAFSRPEELITVENRGAADTTGWVSRGDAQRWAASTSTLRQFTYLAPSTATLDFGDGTEFHLGAWSTPTLLSVLGIRPAAGRWFTPDDERSDAHVLVISDSLRRVHYPTASAALGRIVRRNGVPLTIVGVLPPDVLLPGNPEFWTPNGDRAVVVNIIARRSRAIALEAVQQELQQQAVDWRKHDPLGARGREYVAVSLRARLFGQAEQIANLLLGVSALILILAWVNVVSLTIMRTFERRRELAIRTAVGATRQALTSDVIAESAILTTTGGLFGALLAVAMVSVLLAAAPAAVRLAGASIGIRELVTIAAVAILTTPLVGLIPALMVRDVNLKLVLAENSAQSGRSRHYGTTRRVLAAVQLAVALVLSSGAAIVVRALVRTTTIDFGFDPQNLVYATVHLGTKYADLESRSALYDSLAHRLAALPSVESVAIGTRPLSPDGGVSILRPRSAAEAIPLSRRIVSPEYLATCGLRLKAGRWFSADDRSTTAPVVVLNEAAAHLLFPTISALGNHLPDYLHRGDGPVVIGVIADVLDRSPFVAASPALYTPVAQNQPGLAGTLIVRLRTRNATFASLVKSTATELDPELASTSVTSSEELLKASLAMRRLALAVLVSLAALAIVIATLGLYAVISDSVIRRRSEIAIRRALGQSTQRLIFDLVKETAGVTALGLGCGLLVALGVARLIQPFVNPQPVHDASTLLSCAIGLLVVAVIGTALPARSAAAIEPMELLRKQ